MPRNIVEAAESSTIADLEAKTIAEIRCNQEKIESAVAEILIRGLNMDFCEPIKAQGIRVHECRLICDPDATENQISRPVLQKALAGLRFNLKAGTELFVDLWHSSDGLRYSDSFTLNDNPNLEINLHIPTLNALLIRFTSERP